MSAEVMFELLSKTIVEVEDQLKVTVDGVLRVRRTLVAVWRKWLFFIGYIAHGWQLVSIDILEKPTLVRQGMNAVARV